MVRRYLMLGCCVGLGLMVAGCGEVERITSPGTLSTFEQRALTKATEKAIDQAGLDAEFLGNESLYVEIRGAGAADLGKQHVAGMLVPLIEQQGTLVAMDREQASGVLICTIRLAGVDRQASVDGSYEKARADVDLSFQRRIEGDLIDKRGLGSATIEKGVFLFFPYEKEK